MIAIRMVRVCGVPAESPGQRRRVSPPNQTAIQTGQSSQTENYQLARHKAWAKDPAMKPHISHRFPLSEMKEALRVMAYREMVGRIVMHPQEF